MSELASRVVCVFYGLSIVSVTYIYKYIVKGIVFKQKLKNEEGIDEDNMTQQEEIQYYLAKQNKKDKTKSIIAIIITLILTIITFAFYCKTTVINCLKQNGFSGNIFDEIANVFMTLFLNSILFAVVIYKNFKKGEFKQILSIFSNQSHFKKDIVAPFVEEWIFKILFSIILGKQNGFNIQWYSPLVFSLCHFQLIFFFKNKYGWVGALIKAFGLSVMTFVFGIYSSFIFVKTNSFFSSFLLHSYCNLLGPPSFGSKLEIGLNIVCVALFFLLMNIIPFIQE